MFSCEDYTIDWICDTASTLAAATAILDETHPDLPIRPTDYESYTLGRISRHNIVIVGMPAGEYGAVPTAIVEAQMMHRFESIRFILSLGIAGAVPRNDVRLSHIAVSYPTNVLGSGQPCASLTLWIPQDHGTFHLSYRLEYWAVQ